MTEMTAHTTPGGYLAVTVTTETCKATKYVVGGYPYYVIGAYVAHGTTTIAVHKRTRDRAVARREALKGRGRWVLQREHDGSYTCIHGTVGL